MTVHVSLLLPLFLLTAPRQGGTPSDSAPTAPTATPRFEFAEAPFAVPAELRDTIRFAWLVVPQDHEDPTSGTFRLAVSIVAARTAQPESDPIVLIPGGPGSPLVAVASVDVAQSVRLAPFREHRAVVLLDPRGHGLSDPAMCPGLNDAQPLEENDTLAEAILSGKLSECRAQLVARGVRLETLSSVQTARDIDLLRRALGASQVNLIGSSYGSRLAAEAMRAVPAAIRAVHMDGPLPPDVPHLVADDARLAGVMASLFRRCAEQSECRAAFPRVQADYDSVLSRVARSPLTVRMPRSDRVPDGQILVDSALLRAGLAQLGLNRQLAAAAPLLIHTLATRGLEPLATMAPQLLAMTSAEGVFGTHLAFLCNDSPLASANTTWLPRRCPAWIGERYGDSLALPLQSDIPTLVITGEFDPRTPPAYAEHVASGLSRARVIVAPWTGHERLPDCAFRLASEFFDAPERLLDAACMDSVPPIRFVTDVVPGGWVSSLVARARSGPVPMAVTAGLAMLLLLMALVGIPLRARRTRAVAAASDVFRYRDVVTWLSAAAGLTLLAGVGAAVYFAAARNPLIPTFGVTSGWRWVLLLPWLCLGLWMAALLLGTTREQSTRPLSWWSAMAGGALVIALWGLHSPI